MKSPAVGACLNIEPLMDNLIFISLVLVYRICNLSYKFQVVQFFAHVAVCFQRNCTPIEACEKGAILGL